MDTISIGKHNPRIVTIRRATDRGELTPEGLLPVEGPKLIHEAVTSGLEIVELFLREDVSLSGLPAAKTYIVEPAVFKTIQGTEHSQGVLALVRPKEWSLKQVLDASASPIAVLAGLQDPGNVGTILRVAESFGAAGCLGMKGTAAIHNAKVVRASAGSVFRVPHVWDLDWQTIAGSMKSSGIAMIGTSPHAADFISSWDWNRPTAIVIGNEGAGLTAEQTSACTAVLRIPQQGTVESLNSAVAASVILYESYKRRNPS